MVWERRWRAGLSGAERLKRERESWARVRLHGRKERREERKGGSAGWAKRREESLGSSV